MMENVDNLTTDITKELEIFTSNSPDLSSELSTEEKLINEQEAEFLAKYETAQRVCARLSYGSSCGFANSGNLVYLNNGYNDRSVRVTVRVNWTQGIDRGQFDRTFTLPAGSRRRLGCSRTNNIPVRSFNFSIVGCEVL